MIRKGRVAGKGREMESKAAFEKLYVPSWLGSCTRTLVPDQFAAWGAKDPCGVFEQYLAEEHSLIG